MRRPVALIEDVQDERQGRDHEGPHCIERAHREHCRGQGGSWSVEPRSFPVLTRWSNDLAARRTSTTPLPQTLDQRTVRYERDALGEAGVDFAVYERAT